MAGFMPIFRLAAARRRRRRESSFTLFTAGDYKGGSAFTYSSRSTEGGSFRTLQHIRLRSEATAGRAGRTSSAVLVDLIPHLLITSGALHSEGFVEGQDYDLNPRKQHSSPFANRKLKTEVLAYLEQRHILHSWLKKGAAFAYAGTQHTKADRITGLKSMTPLASDSER
jgi:hypothetical protein